MFRGLKSISANIAGISFLLICVMITGCGADKQSSTVNKNTGESLQTEGSTQREEPVQEEKPKKVEDQAQKEEYLETVETAKPTQTEEAEKDEEASTNDIIPEFDELQKLYVDFSMDASFQEAVMYLDEYGLPYSSEKYNGSRVLQISFEEEGTAQKYNKSGLPYIQIHYDYPKDENSANDDLEKYTFSIIEYVPKYGGYSFEANKEKGTIKKLGDDIGVNVSREEQIDFYYQNR